MGLTERWEADETYTVEPVDTPAWIAEVMAADDGPTNHLPGKHSQKTHGRGGLSSPAAIRQTYERTDDETGLSTKVDNIAVEDDIAEFRGWTRVDISVRNDDGDDVGEATFHISGDGQTVYHSALVLEDGVQGQGFATRQMIHVVDAYRRAGVKTMTLDANHDVGGYAWARAGFSFDQGRAARTGHGRDEIAGRFRNRASQYPAHQEEMRRVASDPDASPIDFAMVGHTPGAKTWPGKEIMLESTWAGKLDL